ncbi:MAG: hypothetical protein IJM51_08955 [Clostridia bacterium]|nr:hypothetical protein [Clostridia bacterium]
MEEGHIVLDLMFGKTRVMICDDYCVQEEEEIDKILRRVGEIVVKHLSAAATEKVVREIKIERSKKLSAEKKESIDSDSI